MDNAIVTVFGGGGFVGRYVVQALFDAGARVRIVQRDPKAAYFLRRGRIGQIQFVAADVRNKESVARALYGSHAVVNLVGAFADMEAIQAEGARNVARAAAAAGVEALVHMSAIGANPDSPSLYGGSKGRGEAGVREAFAGATILRPSIMFGREDGFTHRFARMLRLPVVPVLRPGVQFQPVFVSDVADAVAKAVTDPLAHGGKTYELAGPERLSMADLLKRIAGWTGHSPHFLHLPDAVGGALARFGGWLPGAPITWDQWLMLQHDNVASKGAAGLAALGVAATPISAVAPAWLVQYRKQGRFGGVKTVGN